MRRRFIRSLTAAAALVIAAAAPGAAQAWNARGHMLVAAVAWAKMTPDTRSKVSVLLRQNPMYPRWVAGVPSASRPVTAFLRAATWPDLIRGRECAGGVDPQPPAGGETGVWRGPPGGICYLDDGSSPSGPAAGRNLGYADMLLHRYWHYKDLPFAAHGATPPDPPEPNAATQIVAFREALRSGTEAQKAYDLAWLIHLVGDVHQPLHATARYVDGKSDNGGNGVKVCTTQPNCTLGSGQTLHSFWDGALGADGNLAAIRAEAGRLCNATAVKRKLCDPKPPGADDVIDVDAWVTSSFELARSTAYAAPVGDRRDRAWRLDDPYRTNAARVARTQVALAGARLAKLLDDNL